MAYYNEKDLDNIKKGLQFAKDNPDDPKSQEITNRLKSGKLNFELKALGLKPVPVQKPKVDLKQAFADVEMEKNVQTMQPEQKEPSVISRIAKDAPSDIAEVGTQFKQLNEQRAEKIREIVQNPDLTVPQKFQSGLSQAIFGSIADAIAVGTTGAAKVVSTPELEQKVSELMTNIGENETVGSAVDKYVNWYESLSPESQNMVDSIAPVAEVAGEITLLGKGAKPVTQGIEAGIDAAKTGARVAGEAGQQAIDWTTTNVPPAAAAVYNRLPSMQDVTPRTSGISESLVAGINRVTPGDRTKFKQMTGESMDSWLVDRGMTGTRNDTLTKLGQNFQALRENVDQAIDQIPGTYRDNRVNVVADEALEHARSVESPELGRMTELANKAKSTGLTPKEINELKRYYERNVKVGYMQDPTKTAESVQRATNRDSQLREYLFEIANENGFDNLRELNKEIQATKQLADSIAGRMEGQGANNMMSLTDWIAVSPAAVDPAFISSFVGKKLFSTETARSMFAKLFSAGRDVKEIPRADLDEITKRAQDRLQRTAAAEEERMTNFLMAQDLQDAGFTMSEGDRAFITENPIPLTRQEQELLRVADETAKYDEMLKYILDKKAQGYEIGDGFIMREAQQELPGAGQSSFNPANQPGTINLPQDSRNLTGPIEAQSTNRPSNAPATNNPTTNAIDSTVPQGTMVEQALRRDKEAVEQAVYEMEAEMSGQTRPSIGENFVQTADGAYRFNELPSWIPDNLRSADLMSRVLRNIEEGRTPRANASQEKELQELVQQRITERADQIKNTDTSSGVFSKDTAFAAALMAGGTYFVMSEDGSILPVVAVGAMAANPATRSAALKQINEAIALQKKRASNAQGDTSFLRATEKNVRKLEEQKAKLLEGQSFNQSATTKTTDLLEEARKSQTRQDLYKNKAFQELKTKEESLKTKAQAEGGDAIREWRKTLNEIREIEDTVTENEQTFRKNFQRQKDLELRANDPTVDKLSQKDTSELLEVAKAYKDFEEFASKVRGSATQYGDYTPKLRKFVTPTAKRVSEIDGVDPNQYITIYRGIDNGGRNLKINKGDFVTSNFDEAAAYTDSPANVAEMRVKVRNLIEEYPDDFDPETFAEYGSEFIYQPDKIIKVTDTQLEDIWKQANDSQPR